MNTKIDNFGNETFIRNQIIRGFLLALAIPLAILILYAAFYPLFIMGQKIVQEPTSPESFPLSVAKNAIDNQDISKDCSGEVLNIKIKIPISWKCEIEKYNLNPENDKQLGLEGQTITITSGFFTIKIDNNSTVDPCDAGCQNVKVTQIDFYKSDILNLTFYKYEDSTIDALGSHIAGYFQNNPVPTKGQYDDSMVITYANADTKDLTTDQYNELKKVLDSAEYIKTQ